MPLVVILVQLPVLVYDVRKIGLLVLNSPPGAFAPPGGLYLRLLVPHGLGEKLSFH